ncbi:hypothetical protein ACQEU5_19570 [Marinactinospora thermotolerans]|uniref:Uncharacterized protein n=1 Tax=Marinactinospora thermotolerans DSM 45154 TaxID=1122192 RepID=A0A1T4NPI7_9ACTN|nr:hypothetical protein [Marinactinospora thermotolerans]SJZ81133.1 hypothetical protein SAMN02745673_01535 [Marinactinospora thermotolerans DSM 45154]
MPRTTPPPLPAHGATRRPDASPRLPPELARAFGPEIPGPPCPPGPRANPWRRAGAVPVAVPERERGLLDALWRGRGYHRRADGTPTRIRERPVPSAGAAYPVHTHLVVGTGGALAAGRYVYDLEDGALLRRDEAWEREAGWDAFGANSDVAGTHLVLTVQPGRSFGRYRHRAWPLWIADTAYALAAVEFLGAPAPTSVRLGPGPWLRELLGVARAAEHERWLARGLVPEIPLAAVELPGSWTVLPERRDALAARRSPAIGEFEGAARAPDPHAVEVARACGQTWVLGARRLETWSVATEAPAAEIADVMWRAHRAAAGLCYAGALSREWRCRPVSGFVAADGRWTVHALAMLPGGPDLDKKPDPR